jgi:hypothetical protein
MSRSLVPSKPSAFQPTSRKEHAQGFAAKIGQIRSQKGRSKAAL